MFFLRIIPHTGGTEIFSPRKVCKVHLTVIQGSFIVGLVKYQNVSHF